MSGKFKITVKDINESEECVEFLKRCSITGLPFKVQERLLDIIETKTNSTDLGYRVTEILVLVSAPLQVLIKCDGKWVAFEAGEKWRRVNVVKGVLPGAYTFAREVDMTVLDKTSAPLFCTCIKNADEEAVRNGMAILPVDYLDALEWRLKVAQKLYDDGVILYEGGI